MGKEEQQLLLIQAPGSEAPPRCQRAGRVRRILRFAAAGLLFFAVWSLLHLPMAYRVSLPGPLH